MRIVSVYLENAIGLLRNDIPSIQLNFDDRRGLIAFIGKNGNGKTTLLENMQPYRVSVSRAGIAAKQLLIFRVT